MEKERNAKVNEIYDALPTRTWTGYLSKYLTIVSVVFLLNLVAIIAAVGAQVLHGYDRFEMGVYIRELLVLDVLGFAFLAALFMFIHALSPNMYLGFFICIVIVAVNSFVWGIMDISSNMVKLGGTPSLSAIFMVTSHTPKGLPGSSLYWLLFGSLLAVAGICLWPRGKESDWRKRLSLARQEWKTYKMAGLGLLLLWIWTAGFVFYNTKVLNKPIGRTLRKNAWRDTETSTSVFRAFPNRVLTD